jgi:hypothetical protein
MELNIKKNTFSHFVNKQFNDAKGFGGTVHGEVPACHIFEEYCRP